MALQQRRDLGLLGLADDLPVAAYEDADAGSRSHLPLVSLPAEQPRHRGK